MQISEQENLRYSKKDFNDSLVCNVFPDKLIFFFLLSNDVKKISFNNNLHFNEKKINIKIDDTNLNLFFKCNGNYYYSKNNLNLDIGEIID